MYCSRNINCRIVVLRNLGILVLSAFLSMESFCQSSISTQLADYSDSTCIIKVMAYDLDSVTSFQGTIVLHDSLLLDSITTDLLSLNYNVVSQNTVTYSWFDSSLEGFNFSDSTSLFQLHCKNLAANLCDTLLSFIEIPTEIEVTQNLESINVTHSALISECNYDSTTAFFFLENHSMDYFPNPVDVGDCVKYNADLVFDIFSRHLDLTLLNQNDCLQFSSSGTYFLCKDGRCKKILVK